MSLGGRHARVSKQDRRRATRVNVMESGQVIVGPTAFECAVLDMSVSGVRVSFPEPTSIPETVAFTLDGTARVPAHRRWIRGTQVGLEFVGMVPDGRSEMMPAAANAETAPRGELEATVYAAISPRGFIVRSTIRPNAEEARYALGASVADMGPLEKNGWRIARLKCSVAEVFDLAPPVSETDE